jgi:tetratricopeptide (TPR) repeat protein
VIALYAGLGDDLGQAHAQLMYGRTLGWLSNHSAAIEQAQGALDLYRRNGEQWWEARASTDIARAELALGISGSALLHAERAAQISQALGDAEGEALARDVQGVCLHSQGRYNEAIDIYKASLKLRRTVADLHQESETLVRLAAVYESIGDREEMQRLRDDVDLMRSGAEYASRSDSSFS